MTLLRDLSYAARTLRRSPGFAFVAILALTLGIGLTTTVFSIVYGALMKGLPYEGAERVVVLQRTNLSRDIQRMPVPIHDYLDYLAQQRSFELLAATTSGTINVSGTERAERYSGTWVTSRLFDVYGVRPILGRGIRDDEARPGGGSVVVISYRMWQDRFGGDPSIVGSQLRANGLPHEIVGVMPEGFALPYRTQIWLPLQHDALALKRGEGSWLQVTGRLKPGVSMETADAEAKAVAARIEKENPKENEGVSARVVGFVDGEMGDEPRQVLFTMLGAVFFVLLIACANVANLLLDRAAHRSKEVGIRTALGASRLVVVRQFLAEAMVVAAIGSVLGVALAWGGVELFNRAIVDSEPPSWIDIRLHPPVLLFAIALGLVATIASGLIPAVQSSRADINEVLKDESRGSSSLRIGRISKSLVVFEIALSCGLLVAAGLMIKSVTKMRTMDPGFAVERIFTARLGFPATYTDTLAQRRFYERLQPALAALPGARAVSISSDLPGVNNSGDAFAIEGEAYATDRDYPETDYYTVTPGFFETFGIEARRGRAVEQGDRAETLPVVVVSEGFVAKHLPGEDPIGRRIRFGRADSQAPWMSIVGIVNDIYSGDPDEPRKPTAYRPLAQNHSNFVSVSVGTAGPPMGLTASVRDAVASLEPDIPIYWTYSMADALARPLWFIRVFGTMFMIFGFIALFLASIGLYAVMAFSVSRRTREVGIRMALGARGADVVRMIFRQGLWQLGVGLVAGLGLAVGVSQLMTVMLFEVQPRDPGVFGGVVSVLLLAGLLACLVPARRATRVDPLTALRTD
jgi:putative ABC transport system permease protein